MIINLFVFLVTANLLRANNVLVDQDGEISLGDLGRILPVRGLLIPLTDVDDAISQVPGDISPFVKPESESLVQETVAGSSQDSVVLNEEKAEEPTGEQQN